MDFKSLPEGKVTLKNVTVPACLVGKPGDLVTMDLHLADGKISDQPGDAVEMSRAMVLPCFTDMHTHLDKGHIWPRSANPDGTFTGALTAAAIDGAYWTSEELYERMTFSLQCAYAHGTRAIRTHLDASPEIDALSWPVFDRLREEWADRIALQAVCLTGCDGVTSDGPFRDTANTVARYQGVLGMVTYAVPAVDERIRTFLTLARERGLDADLHVDETMDPDAETLRQIAEIVLETDFPGRVTVGHCCSLSTQDESRALDTLDLVAKAGLHVVSLPLCNHYLQDRNPGRTPRTPRGRGVTLVHEMRARGIPVSFASDNTRDPFYAYGDLDMVEVMRGATRIAHLDHSRTDWITSFTTQPAQTCFFAPQSLVVGHPADIVLFRARDWTEFFARPQSDRIVLRSGKAIDRTLPDYASLDHLWKTT